MQTVVLPASYHHCLLYIEFQSPNLVSGTIIHQCAPSMRICVVQGCIPMGDHDWQRARITQGRPAPGAELTPDYNPLEAGLYHAVSVSKGCYLGQETLSKLVNLDGVKQQLWGLQLSAPAKAGAEISSEGGKVGSVTSVADLGEHGYFGLGYLKSKSRGAQVQLEGELQGFVVFTMKPQIGQTYVHSLPSQS